MKIKLMIDWCKTLQQLQASAEIGTHFRTSDPVLDGEIVPLREFYGIKRRVSAHLFFPDATEGQVDELFSRLNTLNLIFVGSPGKPS